MMKEKEKFDYKRGLAKQNILMNIFIVIFSILLISFILIYLYSFFITPFSNTNLSIDLGILIIKDTFVRFVWILFEIAILIFMLNYIVNWIKTKGFHKFFKNKDKRKRFRGLNEEDLEVRKFMEKGEYISVHKNVRVNSKGLLYITFIRKDNSFINVCLSSKTSRKFYDGQEISRGFFDNLLISKSENKIELIVKNND